jgi:hypothetical protein
MLLFCFRCCELYSKEDVTVVVVGDLLNFYRCVAVHCSSDLQLVKRNPSGTPRDPSTWTQEDKLTEEIKTRVSSLLKSSSAQVQFAEDTFNDRVEDQNLSSETLPSRLRKILMRNRGHTDPLEFLAVAFLAKTQIHIFEEFANGYKLLTKYAHHAYSSRHPLTLLVKPRASGSEHFDVLVVNRSQRQHLTTDGINPFDVLAQSAAEEDRKITFELLLSHGGKTLKQLTDSGDIHLIVLHLVLIMAAMAGLLSTGIVLLYT